MTIPIGLVSGSKIVAITVICVLFAGTAGASYLLFNKNQELTTENKTLETKNRELEAELKLTDSIAKVLAAAQLLNAAEKDDLEAAIKASRQKLVAAEEKIRKEIKDPKEQAKAISVARFSSVVESYCAVSLKSDTPDPSCIKENHQ